VPRWYLLPIARNVWRHDENLSSRLVDLLAEHFPESVHANDVGLHGSPDADLWNYAQTHDLVLISKDNDFRQLSFLRGAPPKVVWLRVGNAPTAVIVHLLSSRKADVAAFAGDADSALLTIQSADEHKVP
jgi:predicted nuclease of predicted toxin-antitoxin system